MGLSEEMEEERDEVVFLEHFYEGISTNLRTLNDRKENDFIVKNLLLGNQGKEIKLLMQQKEILAEDAPYYMLLVLMLTVVYSSRYLRKKTPSSPIL